MSEDKIAFLYQNKKKKVNNMIFFMKKVNDMIFVSWKK
jgi:hypothetical protein